jgi:succinate-acetate transporter protein
MANVGELESGAPRLFAEPTPMGLICLAIACAALIPIAFGTSLTPAGLRTAAMFCLFFGAGGQLLAGLLALANRNLYGGTLFTTFAFNWLMNWWVLEQLAAGKAPDHGVIVAVDAAFLVIFVAMTYGFGFFSRLLFLLLLDIDLIYVFRLAAAGLRTTAFTIPIALATAALAVLSLWIAFAILLNPVAGRTVFPLGGALYSPRRSPS